LHSGAITEAKKLYHLSDALSKVHGKYEDAKLVETDIPTNRDSAV
jgi:hypothetical protein